MGRGDMEQEGVRVSICDQVYYLKSEADRAHTEAIARYVDQRMSTIAARTQTVDTARIAVLAALHIADELLCLRQDYENLRGRVETKSRQYTALLEEVLEPSAPAVAGTGD